MGWVNHGHTPERVNKLSTCSRQMVLNRNQDLEPRTQPEAWQRAKQPAASRVALLPNSPKKNLSVCNIKPMLILQRLLQLSYGSEAIDNLYHVKWGSTTYFSCVPLSSTWQERSCINRLRWIRFVRICIDHIQLYHFASVHLSSTCAHDCAGHRQGLPTEKWIPIKTKGEREEEGWVISVRSFFLVCTGLIALVLQPLSCSEGVESMQFTVFRVHGECQPDLAQI